jgi:myo-inositol 2-dehydrogenase / D-chiro-inositol 1-dehydrogenase
MERIRIGVVGLGFGRHHVRTLANMEDAHLVAAADDRDVASDPPAAFAAAHGAAFYDDGIEMIEREPLDAVTLCVSPRFREPLLAAALRRRVAVFVEKPWAADLAQARRLVALCRGAASPVMVGFSFRFHPAIVRLRELLSGELGAPWAASGSYVFDWRPHPGHWLWDPANGGGFFNENSCHLFDAVCALLGPPESVMAETAVFAGSPSAEIGALSLRFAAGAVAALAVGGLGAAPLLDYPRLDLYTAHGEARVAGRHHMWESLRWARRDGGEERGFTAPPESLGSTRYTRAFAHFFECVRTGRRPATGPVDGLTAVAIASAIAESAITGHRARIDMEEGA